MWVVIGLFALTTLVLGWVAGADVLALRLAGLLHRKGHAPLLDDYPAISIVIPTHDNATYIDAKMRNLLECDYPPDRLEIIFVDGQSTDETLACLRRRQSASIPVNIVMAPRPGRVHQINHVLPALRGQFVIITTPEAHLRGDCLKQIAAEFAANPGTSVLGACVLPPDANGRALCEADSRSRLRLVESDAFSSSGVPTACYAFRRELLHRFPDDVRADGAYIANFAISRNHRVLYSRQAIVDGTVASTSAINSLSRRVVESTAELREVLRFAYRFPEMGFAARRAILAQVARHLLIPYATALWMLLGLALFQKGFLSVVVAGAACIALSRLSAGWALRLVDMPLGAARTFGIFTRTAVLFESLCAQLATGLLAPWIRHETPLAPTRGKPAPQPAPPPRRAPQTVRRTIPRAALAAGALDQLQSPMAGRAEEPASRHP